MSRKLICRYCNKELYGGKGDYWHVHNNEMKCSNGNLSYPKKVQDR